MQKSLFALSLMVGYAVAQAAPQTVTLAVSNMYCEVCPITVKKSLEKVPGVSKVDVSFKNKEAVVHYDDAKAKLGNLLDATLEAGYPSEVKAKASK